ncbi:MAG: CsbD family protein [Actinomycetota bacterium]|nr:CsbD family protein [Actinomycetota bacterium]
MGAEDKLRNEAQTLKGTAKEKLGDATDNESMQAEGQMDKTAGNVKQAGEKVKDAFKS